MWVHYRMAKTFEVEHVFVTVSGLDAELEQRLNDDWDIVTTLFTVSNPTHLAKLQYNAEIFCVFKREVKN